MIQDELKKKKAGLILEGGASRGFLQQEHWIIC